MYDRPDEANTTGIMDGETRRDDPRDRVGASSAPAVLARKPDRLDTETFLDLHRNLLGHYVREIDRQGDNRRQMARDEDFYDNDPYTAEEKAILAARGQLATNFNVIATTLNWVIGTERRGRTDYKILPRRKEGSRQAERKSQLMKYLSDANRSGFAISKAFEEQVKAGLGWLESGWQADDEGEPVYDRAEPWRNILHDSMAQENDLSDARYVFRSKWMDRDLAQAYFPGRAAVIRRATSATYDFGGVFDSYGDDAMDSAEQEATMLASRSSPEAFGGERERVRMIEAWFRKPALTRIMGGGDFSGEIFDEWSDGHMAELDSGRAEMIERVKMRTYVGIMTTSGLVTVMESPYRHNRFPFTPLWCYRRGRDGMPYGMIRGLRDLQTHINRSAAKAQYILSTNKTIMDKGAVDDLDQYEEEAARPDAIIVVNPGKRLDMNVDRDLAPAHLDLMSRMIQMVQTQSGVTDENLGRSTNATSGKAIIARQEQGSLATAAIFDNLKFAMQVHGEKMLSLMEQFFNERKQFRITNSRGTPEFIDINDGMPENTITLSKADYVISEDDWNATHRQAQVESLMNLVREIAPGAPQILMLVLDLLVEMMDIPSKDEVVRRIRQATGMKDPDADPNEPPSPEEQAQMQAKAEEAAMAKRGAMAQIDKTEAEAAEKRSRAAKADIDAKKLIQSLAGQNLDTQIKAFEAAIHLLSAPQVAEVGDALLIGAGYSAAAANEAIILQDMVARSTNEAVAQAIAPPPPPEGQMPGPEQAGPTPPQQPMPPMPLEGQMP